MTGEAIDGLGGLTPLRANRLRSRDVDIDPCDAAVMLLAVDRI